MEHLFAGLCHGPVNDLGLKEFYVIDDFGSPYVITEVVQVCEFVCQAH